MKSITNVLLLFFRILAQLQAYVRSDAYLDNFVIIIIKLCNQINSHLVIKKIQVPIAPT